MIDALFSQPNYVATKKMLDAAVLRHEAIASNLANIERPGYKRLDIAPSFSTELHQAMAGADAQMRIIEVVRRLENDGELDPEAQREAASA